MDEISDDSQISVSDNTAFISVPGKAARTINSGEILGDNYQLLELLGHGGMGVVYRCKHLLMGHEYALKILSPHMVNEFSWKRFEVEGQIIAKLSHGNIVKIYNMGVYQGECPFYVMELLSGLSLERYVQKHGTLTNQQALVLALTLSHALAYAHAKGIVHRDLKPSNIMLPAGNFGPDQINDNNFRQIKIVDFGLAKLIGKQDYAGQSLTNVGDVFGSPLYMSPEQGMGKAIDERSDIYSLGCTLFKLLSGKAPFHGANAFQTLLMHQQEPLPELNSVAPDKDIAAVWQTIIQKMMAKNPAVRYQSMEQLHHDLGRLKSGKEITAYGAEKIDTISVRAGPNETTTAWWRNRVVFALTLFLALGCFAFSAVLLWPKPKAVVAKAAPREISISSFALDPQVDGDLPQGQRHEIEADFKAFQGKPTTYQNAAGKMTAVMHFPGTSIANVSNGVTIETAQNTVKMPLARNGLSFNMKASVNRCTFDFPWILKKIDGTIFSAISIDRASYNSAIGFLREDNEKDPYDLNKVLETVCSWPHVAQLYLDEFDLDGPSGSILDRALKLEDLNLKKAHIKEEAFNGHQFLNRLSTLCLIDSKNVDAALKYLTDKSALKMVELDGTTPSIDSLRALARCAHLKNVGIEGCPMTEAHWQALSELPPLKVLSLRHIKIKRSQIENLGCMTAQTKLLISDNCVTPSEALALKRKFPNLDIYQEKHRLGGSATQEIFK